MVVPPSPGALRWQRRHTDVNAVFRHPERILQSETTEKKLLATCASEKCPWHSQSLRTFRKRFRSSGLSSLELLGLQLLESMLPVCESQGLATNLGWLLTGEQPKGVRQHSGPQWRCNRLASPPSFPTGPIRTSNQWTLLFIPATFSSRSPLQAVNLLRAEPRQSQGKLAAGSTSKGCWSVEREPEPQAHARHATTHTRATASAGTCGHGLFKSQIG